MTNLNQIKKEISKESKKVSINDASKLLAKFFYGEVIEIEEVNINDA